MFQDIACTAFVIPRRHSENGHGDLAQCFLMKRSTLHFYHLVDEDYTFRAGTSRWELPVAQPTWQIYLLNYGQGLVEDGR
jgi:hypothetical protein